jgi:uncharacterized protein
MIELSALEARRIAIAAQGLASPRPARVTRRELAALVDRLGVLQLDSVNVLARSHYLVAFSRLGAYDRAALDALSHEGPRALFEYWGHEASLLPVAMHPIMRWRMARARDEAWRGVRAIARRTAFVERVRAAVAEHGPVCAGDITVPRARRGEGGWWGWSEIKTAVEWLFWSGAVTTAARRRFERLYDLPERVLPAAVVTAATPSEHDAHRALVERAARALGVATERDLGEYYRLRTEPVRRAVADLVTAGTLERVAVAGWRKPGYLHAGARAPASCERAALLSPFDSLIWNRERTERLFGMRYRIELYTPAPERVYGYYVLPFLLGDELVGRVDLKADRAGGRLLVHAAHAHGERPRAQITAALAQELRILADWLGLPRIAVARKGELARGLARTVR